MSQTQPVRILVRDLVTSVRLGIHAHEQHAPQRIVVNLSLLGDMPLVPASIADCIDYDHIYQRVVQEWPMRAHVDLIETLLLELVDFCFARDSRIHTVTASITKPDIFAEASGVGVEITKMRDAWKAESRIHG